MNVVLFTDVLKHGFARYAGVYRLASELRNNGYTCQVVEFFSTLSLDEITRIIDRYVDNETLIVGFTTTLLGNLGSYQAYMNTSDVPDFWLSMPRSQEWMSEVFELVRKKSRKAKIVVGGGRAVEQEFSGVDYYVLGLADRSIISLAKHIQEKGPITATKGKWPASSVIDSNKDYSFAHFSSATINWHESDLMFPNEIVPIEIARGCRFRCAYCAYPFNGKDPDDYLKNEDILRNELITNYERYGITDYIFSDDTYNDSIEKVRSLHKLFTSLPFRITFVAYCRLDLFQRHPEMRELLAESGMRAAIFGIETLNPMTGKIIGKGLNPERTKELLYFLRDGWKNSVSIATHFIVGLPGETEESIYKTHEWLEEKDNPIDCKNWIPLNIYKTYYSSSIDLDPKKYGYEISGETDSGKLIWKNDYMTMERASEIKEDLQNRLWSRNKMTGFLIARITNMGLDWNEVSQWTYGDLFKHHHSLVDSYQALRSSYLKKLLS